MVNIVFYKPSYWGPISLVGSSFSCVLNVTHGSCLQHVPKLGVNVYDLQRFQGLSATSFEGSPKISTMKRVSRALV